MSNYYISSTAYSAVAQWASSHTYATGAIVRQLAAPAVNSERCFRVTAGGGGNSGGTEPSWNLGSNATTTDGALTWTECTAQEAHQQDNGTTTTWACPAARLNDITSNGKNVLADGDSVFFSSDHAETQATTLSLPASFTHVECVSVDRTTGNVPPHAADITAGASLATTASHDIYLDLRARWTGFTFNSSLAVRLGQNGGHRSYLKTCTIEGTGGFPVIFGASDADVTWDNCTYKAGATSDVMLCNNGGNTVLRIVGGIIDNTFVPTNLFSARSNGGAMLAEICGMDLSALGSGKNIVQFSGSASTTQASRFSFRNCKLGASVTPVNTTNGVDEATGTRGNLVEFINCDSGNTNYNNSWYRYPGTITTETTITRTGGASDGAQAASRKLVSNANALSLYPLEHHIWQWNTLTGSSHTATVEVISSGTLNNNDIDGRLEYLADSGDCLSGFVDDGLATVLTSSAAQTSSSASWNSSPATPVTQKLSVTFTPQKAGLLHFVIRLYKASATVWVDHLITVT